MVRLVLALGLVQAGFHAFIASLPIALVDAGWPDDAIGALMGAAAVFNIGAALASGVLIDRYGGRAVFLVGAGCLCLASMLLALRVATPESGGLLLLVRFLQGAGLAGTIPAALSLVPGLVSKERLPTALGLAGVAANVSLAAVPPISIEVLDQGSLELVSILTAAVVAVGAVLIIPLRAVRSVEAREAQRSARWRPAWRPAWFVPLAIAFLFVSHWGVVTGFLPQRAEAAGAEVGLFFTGDALAVLALRVPAGWLAGKIGSLPLLLAGVTITGAALALLLLPPTTPLLVLSGVGTGAGAALLLPTLMLELSKRSDDSDRGSAFALFQVAFGSGIAIGSLGVAPVYAAIGFSVALAVGIAGCAAAGALALTDRTLRHPRALAAHPEAA